MRDLTAWMNFDNGQDAGEHRRTKCEQNQRG
jgi:hypothetical protein